MAPTAKEMMQRKPNESAQGVTFTYKGGANKAFECIRARNLNYYYHKNKDTLDDNRTKEMKRKEEDERLRPPNKVFVHGSLRPDDPDAEAWVR